MVNFWKILFCSMHCFMISICDAEPEFNGGTNEWYHLLNHHKGLKQLKTFEHEKLLLLKPPQNTKKKKKKTVSNITITEKKEKQ